MFRFVIFGTLLAAAIDAFVENDGSVGTQCLFNPGGLPLNFQVQGCSSNPCSLPQLQEAVFNVKFKAPHDSEALKTKLVVYLMGVAIPFDLGPASQACSFLANASCPVKEGQELEYTLKLPIEAYIPAGLHVALEISMLDDVNYPAFCARVPVLITFPRNLNKDVQVVN